MKIVSQIANSISKGGHASRSPAHVPATETAPAFATLTFQNYSLSTATPSESYVAFGMAFKKGDVSSTQTPKLRYKDNQTDIPGFQFDLRNTWPDGSLRWCEVSCIVGSIAAGQEREVEVYAATASYDNTQVRNITDITGSTDFTVNLTSVTDFNSVQYESGTLEASFNDDVASAELIKSGPVCDQWRVRAPFNTQTRDHLEAYFYVTAWTKDSDGTLAAISHITKVHNGFINLAGATRFLYNAAYKNGVSTIRSHTGISQPSHTDWWSCDTDGRSDWTASEATIHVEHDVAYLHSTGLIPPYDLTVVVSPNSLSSPHTYTPMAATAGDYRENIEGTGQADHIGFLPQWCARAFLSQDTGYQTHARVHALLLTTLPNMWINEATGRIPTVRGSGGTNGSSGDWTGLGTLLRDTHWFNSSNKSSDTVTALGGTGIWTGSTNFDWSHHPDGMHYTLVTEGGAHLMDAQIIYANHGLFHMSGTLATGLIGTVSRARRVGSGDSAHYGIWLQFGQGRSIAWKTRTLANLRSVIPDGWNEKPYFDAVIAGNADYFAYYLPQQSANFNSAGHWSFQVSNELDTGTFTVWIMGAAAMMYKHTEDADWLAFANHTKIAPVALAGGEFPCTLGITNYRWTARSDVAGQSSTYVSLADIGIWRGETLTADATTNVITYSFGGSVLWDTIADGDRVKWCSVNQALGAQTIPGGITANQFYYVINHNGAANTFQISATQGGSAIDITSNGSNCSGMWRPTVCPSAYLDANHDTFLPYAHASLCIAEANGISGITTRRAALEAFQIADFATAPGWAMQETL